MIDGSGKRNRQLAFELQSSHVCEKRSNNVIMKKKIYTIYHWSLIKRENTNASIFHQILSPNN